MLKKHIIRTFYNGQKEDRSVARREIGRKSCDKLRDLFRDPSVLLNIGFFLFYPKHS